MRSFAPFERSQERFDIEVSGIRKMHSITVRAGRVKGFELTCTAIKVEEGAYCQDENALYLWAWYFLSSIAFSGLIMKLTKTQMDLG